MVNRTAVGGHKISMLRHTLQTYMSGIPSYLVSVLESYMKDLALQQAHRRLQKKLGRQHVSCKHVLSSSILMIALEFYNTIQYNTIQYNTIQYNTIQYNTITLFKHEDVLYKARYLRYLENSCHSTVVAYRPL